jgi:GWxTD domain-containing protein
MIRLETWLETPLAAAAGWTLFHSLWEGAVVAIVLAATLALTRSARTRYLAACLAMCAVVLCFAVTLLRLAPRHLGSGAARNAITLRSNPDANVAGTPQTPPGRLADVLPWLVPFWISGVILFYLRHLASWVLTRRLRRTGVCCPPDFWQERLNGLGRRVRLSRPVTLLESGLARVPIVIGHLRPVILMPVGLLTGLPAGQIELILLHELAHIRRYDYLVNMLQTSVEGLLFYHPVVWWISGVMRTEREHCCDDLAVSLSGDARAYASALATLEQRRCDAAQTALAATGGNLVKRIRRLLIPAERSSSSLTPFVSAAILLITAAVGLTAWQATAPATPEPAAVSPYTKWLNEDVVYIILPAEREAYLKLETDQERQEFIKQFWLHRDPTPDTPKNEFMEEHYRRIAQANLRFPTATGTPGWKTDRGRIYIVYGPPDEIDDHSAPGLYNRPGDTGPHSIPYIDWTYRWIEGVGTNVTVEFADPAGTHEFHMTMDPNPPKDGSPREPLRYVNPNQR